ncbi:hypothetical protein ABTZ78_12660 [Streptomyces bauhiniae]|uniref:hypothetical protein n=1 Tax=Streptomyces bauhiniae TaxID=2340725 RepID=UPI0033279F03
MAAFVALLLWVKWLPYSANVIGLDQSHQWSGTSILGRRHSGASTPASVAYRLGNPLLDPAVVAFLSRTRSARRLRPPATVRSRSPANSWSAA